MVGIKEEGSYRRVGYSVSLRSNVGQWTFRVDVRPSNDLGASETFISPGFYNTDVEAHRAAVVFRRRPHHLTGCNAWCAYGS